MRKVNISAFVLLVDDLSIFLIDGQTICLVGWLITTGADMTKQQTISARIATLIATGHSVEAAVDAVLGAGTYAKIAADVWSALRADG